MLTAATATHSVDIVFWKAIIIIVVVVIIIIIIIIIITGRICRRQLCRYCFYSRADFGVFCPAGATRDTDQGEIWWEGQISP